jgi:hypothetical protein
LIVAFFALGVFEFKKEDPLVEAGLRAAAAKVVQDARHDVSVKIDGRDLTLIGLVDSMAEKTRFMKGLRDISGRGSVAEKVTVLKPASPFRTEFSLEGSGDVAVEGHVPSEAAQADLAQIIGHDLEAVVLASGAHDNWRHWAKVAVRALMQLEQGRARLEDRRLVLDGAAMSPLEAARARRVLQGMSGEVETAITIAVLDDGSPVRISARRTIDGATILSGKIPDRMALEKYDLSGVERTPLAPPVKGWEAAVHSGLQAFEALQNGHLSVIGRSLTLNGEVWSQVAMRRVEERLAKIPASMMVTLDVEQLDDGQPFDLKVKFDGEAGQVSGKAPRNLSLRVQAAFLDHPLIDAGLETARIDAPAAWWQAATIGLDALKHLERGKLRVHGGQLTLDGQAFSPKEQAVVNAVLNDLPEAVTLDLNLGLRDDGRPAHLALHFDEGQGVVQGKLPETLGLEDIAQALGADVRDDGFSVAYLPVEKDFTVAVRKGLEALSLSVGGRLSVSTGQVGLSAVLQDPAAGKAMMAVIERLPKRYERIVDLSYLDDGAPFVLQISYDGTEAISAGKVPRDLGLASQKAIFGHDIVAGELSVANTSASPEWWAAARAAIIGLSMLESGVLKVDGAVVTLSGRVTDARRKREIEQRLSGLPQGYDPVLTLTYKSELESTGE